MKWKRDRDPSTREVPAPSQKVVWFFRQWLLITFPALSVCLLTVLAFQQFFVCSCATLCVRVFVCVVCTHMSMHVCVYVCLCVYTIVCVCMLCMCVASYVCVCCWCEFCILMEQVAHTSKVEGGPFMSLSVHIVSLKMIEFTGCYPDLLCPLCLLSFRSKYP